jgi:hypothetical protein
MDAQESTAFSTWIPDVNRFGLEAPPDWFLQRLRDFDHRLVIIPSRKGTGLNGHERGSYILAIRRLHSAGIGDVAMLDNKHPDTNMLHSYGLLPIAPLKFGKDVVVWTEHGCTQLINTLKARDTWALTGGPDGKDPDAAWQAVEQAEADAAARERATFVDNMRHRARDAWRSILARTKRRNKRASDYHGAARAPRKLANG